MKDPNFYNLTKKEMIAAVNDLFTRAYGVDSKVTSKVEAMAKVKWAVIYQVAYLWRNDSAVEAARLVDQHIAFQVSF